MRFEPAFHPFQRVYGWIAQRAHRSIASDAGIQKRLSEKGDVERQILWFIVLLILLILIIALFFSGAYQLIQTLFINELIK